MSRKPLSVPSYRLHKPSGRAFVEIRGQRQYLGKHGAQESLRAYAELIARQPSLPPVPSSQNSLKFTVNELILRYYRGHVGAYYVRNGVPTQEQANVRHALRFLRAHFGDIAAIEFGPLSLKSLVAKMIDHGLARTTVNGNVSRVRRMFRWAVSEEILPPAVIQALDAVPGLRRGRSQAREPVPIGPVPIGDVEATLPYLSPTLAAMVQLQLLSGCRPGEICSIRTSDIEMLDGAWRFRPRSHKTDYRGLDRQIFFGPRAQGILRQFLNRKDAEAYCFAPCLVEQERAAQRRLARKSPMTPSQLARKAKPNGRRRPRDRYSKDSYRRAIARACERAFPTHDVAADVAAAHRLRHWAPNRLRHTRATELRSKYGIDAAAAVLGHADLKATQVYAAKDFERAASIMTQIG